MARVRYEWGDKGRLMGVLFVLLNMHIMTLALPLIVHNGSLSPTSSLSTLPSEFMVASNASNFNSEDAAVQSDAVRNRVEAPIIQRPGIKFTLAGGAIHRADASVDCSDSRAHSDAVAVAERAASFSCPVILTLDTAIKQLLDRTFLAFAKGLACAMLTPLSVLGTSLKRAYF